MVLGTTGMKWLRILRSSNSDDITLAKPRLGPIIAHYHGPLNKAIPSLPELLGNTPYMTMLKTESFYKNLGKVDGSQEF